MTPQTHVAPVRDLPGAATPHSYALDGHLTRFITIEDRLAAAATELDIVIV